MLKNIGAEIKGLSQQHTGVFDEHAKHINVIQELMS
jgi:hypothetical protein